MTHAPSTTSFPPYGDGTILGCFREKDHDKFFEFSRNDEDFYTDYPHKVWVTTPYDRRRPHASIVLGELAERHMDEGWRFARVLKTVAHVLTTGEDGYDLVEKWQIKQRRAYT
jgi:hypothetical protein